MARDLTDEMDQLATDQQMQEIVSGVSDEVIVETQDQAPVTPEDVIEANQPVTLPEDQPVQVASLKDAFVGGVDFISKKVSEAEKRSTATLAPDKIQTVGSRLVVREADQADIMALETTLERDFTKGLNLPAIMTASGDFDLAGYMQQVKTLNQDLFEEARRGTLNYEALLDLAEQQGTDKVLKNWLTRTPGRGDAAEDLLAGLILARDLTRQTQNSFDLARAATDVDERRQLFANAAQFMTMEFALYQNLSGAASEAGRILYAMQQAQKIGVDTRRAPELLNLLEKEGINIEHLGNLYLSLPNNSSRTQFVQGLFSKGADVLTEVYINSILSSFVTHSVNIAGNSMFMLTKGLEEMVSGAIGSARTAAGIGGKDRVYAREGLLQLQTIGTSFIDATLVAGKAFAKEEASDLTSKIDVRNRRAIGSTGDFGEMLQEAKDGNYASLALNVVGTYARMSGRFMLAEDEFFKAIAYRASVKKQALHRQYSYYDELIEGGTDPETAKRLSATEYQNILDAPPESVMNNARDAAKELTFQGDLDGFAGDMQGFMSHPAVKLFGVAFFKTPMNVIGAVKERSPLQLISPSFYRAVKAGGREADMALGKFVTGTSLMAGFGYMASGLHSPDNNVIIMGAGPTDPQARQAMERLGLMPHTVNFKMEDGTYRGVSYSRLDPMSGLLAMAADYAYYSQYSDDMGELETIMTAAGLGLYNYSMQMPFLDGVADLTRILNNADPAMAFEQAQSFFAERATTAAISIVPTVSSLAAGIERVQDPRASSTLLPAEGFFGEDPTQSNPMVRGFYTALQKAKARHPMFSADVPPSLNLWGEVRQQGNGAGWELWSPIRITNPKYSGVDRVLMELGDGIAMPSRKISGVLLNNEQYNFMIRAMNAPDPSTPTMLDELENLINMDVFLDLPTKEDKLTSIKAVTSRYSSAARKMVMLEYPDIAERVLK